MFRTTFFNLADNWDVWDKIILDTSEFGRPYFDLSLQEKESHHKNIEYKLSSKYDAVWVGSNIVFKTEKGYVLFLLEYT
jgi:hypothetical protein